MAKRDLDISVEVSLQTAKLDQDIRNTVKKTRALDRAFRGISGKGLTRVERELRKASRSASQLDKRVQSAKANLSGLGHQAGLTARRFIIYNVIAGFFFRLAAAVNEGLTSFISFDQELNKAKQILNPLITDFKEFTDTIFKLGNEFGASIKDIQAAQEVFIRQGKSQKEVVELTRQSLSLASAAGIEFAEATEAITAAINQFQQEGLKAVEVADKLTAVSIRFAVTANDLDEGVRRAGAAAATVGVEFNNLIGFIAAAQEATRRGGRVIGTGLRTVFTRIFRAPAVEALEELGIQMRAATGEFRAADAIIADLAGKFTELSRTQQIAIASTIAGQRQIATLLSVLRNFDRATQASDASQNSFGEAARLTAIKQEALSIQLQKVINQFIQFGKSIGEAIGPEIIEGIQLISGLFANISEALSGTGGSTFLTSLLGTMTKLSGIMLLQLAGVGKLGDKWHSYKAKVKESTQQLKDFQASQGKVVTTRQRLFGPNKAEEKGMAKQSFEKSAKAEQEVSLKLANLRTVEEGKQLKLDQSQASATALDNTRHEIAVRIGKTQLVIKKKILKITELTAKIDVGTKSLQREERALDLSRKNLAIHQETAKSAKATLTSLVGSRGTRLPGAAGGVFTARDRKKTADELVKANQEMLKLQTQMGPLQKRALTNQAASRKLSVLTEKFEKQRGVAAEKRQLLSKNATAQEKAAIKSLAQANRDVLKESNAQINAKEKINALTIANKDLEVELKAVQRDKLSLDNKIIANKTALGAINIKLRQIQFSGKGTEQQINDLIKQRTILMEQQAVLATDRDAKEKKYQNLLKGRGLGASKMTGGRLAGAFGISIGLSTAAQTLREFGDESNKVLGGIADSTEAIGSGLSTAFLLGFSPLGLILGSLQAVVGIVKAIINATHTWEKAMEATEERISKMNNRLRASRSLFDSVRETARAMATEGFSATLNQKLLDDLEKVDETFSDLTNVQIRNLKSELRSMALTGDFAGLEKAEKQARKLQSAIAIEKGSIISVEELDMGREKLAELTREIESVEDALRKIEAMGAEAFLFTNEFQEGPAVTSLKQGKEKLKELREEADIVNKQFRKTNQEVIQHFLSYTDGAQTAQEAISKIPDDLLVVAKNMGLLGELNRVWLEQEKGVKRVGNANAALGQRQIESIKLGNRIRETFQGQKSDVDNVISALHGMEDVQGTVTTSVFKVDKAIDQNSAKFKQLVNVMAEVEDISPEEALQRLQDALKNGTLQAKLFTNGAKITNAELDGFLGTLAKSPESLALFVQFLRESGTFQGALNSDLDKTNRTMQQATKITLFLGRAYEALANQTDRTTQSLSRIRAAYSEVTRINQSIVDVSPSEAFRKDAEGIERLTQGAAKNLAIMTRLNATHAALQNLAEANAIALGKQFRDSLLRAGERAEGFDFTLGAAKLSVSELRAELGSLQAFLVGLELGDDIGLQSVQKEAIALTTQLAALAHLEGAVLGIDSMMKKLEGDSRDLLESERKTIKEHLAIINKGVDVEGANINLGLDNKSVQKSLDGLLKRIRSLIRTEGSEAFRNAGFLAGTAFIEGTAPAIKGRGDSLIKDLQTILTKATAILADKLVKPVGALRESFNKLGAESKAALEFAVDDAFAAFKQLNELVSKGIVPDAGVVTQVLIGDFDNAKFAIGKQIDIIKSQIEEVTERRERILALKDKIIKSDLTALEKETQLIAQRKLLVDSTNELSALGAELLVQKKQEIALTKVFTRALVTDLGLFAKRISELVSAQKSLADGQIALVRLQTTFTNQELLNTEDRLALLEQERLAIANIRSEIQSIGTGLSVDELGQQIVDLTQQKLKQAPVDAAEAALIDQKLNALNAELKLRQNLSKETISSLQKQLKIIEQQKKAIQEFALGFLAANREQQAQIINASRLTDKFFGHLTSGSFDTSQVKSSIVKFIKVATDEQRAAVVDHLKRLKAIGADIAPGVSAASFLAEMGSVIGGAVLDNPQVALAQRQTELQTKILASAEDGNKLSRVGIDVAIEQLKVASNLLVLTAATGRSKGALSPEIQQKAAHANASGLAVASRVSANINEQRSRLKAQSDQEKIQNKIKVSNKSLVDTFRKIDTAGTDAGLTLDEFRAQMVELNNKLIGADDALIDAQTAFDDAISGVHESLVKAAIAQAQYNIGISEAERVNINAADGFTTFRDEIKFVTQSIGSQITALQQVGASEQQLADLRVQLAQEQLRVIEGQISQFRDTALQLFTGQLSPNDLAAQARAANVVGDIVAKSSTSDQLFAQLANLPEDLRAAAVEGLSKAPPGTTFGGLGADEVMNRIANVFGGQTAAGDSIESLQEEAATQRKIIAENSTSQLFAAQTATNAALEQVATAKEALLAAKAQKELVELQLSELRVARTDQNDIMSAVANNVRTVSDNVLTSGERVARAMAEAGETIQIGFKQAVEQQKQEQRNSVQKVEIISGPNSRSASSFGGGLAMIPQNPDIFRAKGSLTPAEVGGLISAGEKEKGAMPIGAGLGVFNTSETVLTRNQMRRLRSRGSNIPNAVGGHGPAAGGQNIEALLVQISERLRTLNVRGVTQEISVGITNERRVSVEGLAGLQTALQQIITDRTGDLYTREEARAVEEIVQLILTKMQETGQVSSIGT